MALLDVLVPRTRGAFTATWRYAFIVWFHLIIGSPPGAAAQITPEYQIKAVFLFNFAQFVDWPANAFPAAETPLVIGVIGEDPFGPYLDDAVRGETVNHHPLVVKRYRRVEEIGNCHVLYVSASVEERVEQILAKLKGRSVLTVGDSESLAENALMIRFVTVDNKIRLRINLDAAKAAALTISSKLLRPAEIVANEGN